MISRPCILPAAVTAAFLLLLTSCEQEKMTEYARGEGVEKARPMPEDAGGSDASFALAPDEFSLREAIGARAHVFSPEDEIYFKSSLYHPGVDGDGQPRLDVPEAGSGEYLMFLYPKGSRYWFTDAEQAPLKGLIIPYSQFYGTTAALMDSYPMMAEYDPAEEGIIRFRELLSAVSVTVRGSGKLASVHLQNKSASQLLENNLAGVASFTTEGNYELTEGVNFVNLNCTDGGKGVEISPSGTTFYLIVAPGSYSEGLRLTLTSMDHKGQVFDVSPFTVAPGELKALEGDFSFAPEEDLLFFEHFDNFVWGGNVQGNQAVSSYAPDASSNPNDDPGARTGYEQAFVKVGVTTPGSAFIQNNWATVNGWTVGERPSVNPEYVTSRNIGDLVYMYRAQEFQGCVSLGGMDETRGLIQPLKSFPVTDALYYNVKLSFDMCYRYNGDDLLSTMLSGSGIAERLVVDGEEVVLETTMEGNNTYTHSYQNTTSLFPAQFPGPLSERYEEGWHHVEITYSGLNELSQLRIQGQDAVAAFKHGVLVDNIEIRRVPRPEVAERPLRVLMFNIQYGMWADQANNFDGFAAFIKKYDPDVCVFCEAKSGWKDGVATNAGASQYRLFKNNRVNDPDSRNNITNNEWKALAARWGHNYHAVGAYWFNDAHTNINLFPQVITSKYPITTVSRLHNCAVPGESNVSLTRGGGHFQIQVYGETVNIVTVHLWPFKYRYNNNTSTENREGYTIQRRELKGALHATVDRTDCGDNWLIMGDMNSISPLDEEYYYAISYKEYNEHGDKWMATHRQVVQRPEGPIVGELVFSRPLYDMLREGEGSLYTGPGRFPTSTGGQVRYDIMYGSESMRRRVDAFSMVLHDSWSSIRTTSQYDPEDDTKKAKIPSDHMPVLVEFDMSK